MTIMLDRWEIRDMDPGADLEADARRGAADGWIPIEGPGDTYRALIDAGRLDDPFVGRNETAAAWVRDREWWWRTRFEMPEAGSGDDRIELVFEGLDTFASIWLDGRLIGRTDNMFRRHVFDITDTSRETDAAHWLVIRFDPPARAVPEIALPVWSAFTDRVSRSRRNLMRKAQFGWGWDWGPDLPTVGVWRPAFVRRCPAVAIADLAFMTTRIEPAEARARLRVELSGDARAAHALDITLTGPDGRIVVRERVSADLADAIELRILAPQLWWTADLGSQPLYDLSVRLMDGERLMDTQSRRIGLRTVTLDTSPDSDEPGTSFFRFVLNGRPLFAKGACWIPPSSFVAVVDPARYRGLLGQAVRVNMNMIRVWGGGVYEPDVFYDLCDELGLLVWQDFMFACAHYPDADPAFTATVRAEIEDQVRRLRHHPSLALWCGNNESQAMHRINADLSGDSAPLSGTVLYDDLIPSVLAELDPATPYWPGSPSGGPNPNSMQAGDIHDWTVWHGVPPIPEAEMQGGFDSSPEGVAYARYAEDTGRFISEFGIQAAPSLRMLERWMDPDDLALGSEGFLERVKDEAHKADAMMLPVTGLPRTLGDYVDFTMWTQAEGLKFGIEHFRRRSPHCSGALIWQFNDCWPCVSWSLVDYDGGEKASWHAVRRAFAPILASFKDLSDDRYEAWITNDTLQIIAGRAQVTLQTLAGDPVLTHDVDYTVAPGAHIRIWTDDVRASEDQVLIVRSLEDRFAPNRRLLVPIRRLRLDTEARPVVSVDTDHADGLQIVIQAPAYLAFVHLACDRPDVTFSDNYFDLTAGESCRIKATGTGPVCMEEITVSCWNEKSVPDDNAEA